VQSGAIPAGSALVSVPLSFPVLLNQYLFQAAITVPVSDYLLRAVQSYASASHSEKAARAMERATALKVAADAKSAYYAWARAKLAVIVADQATAQAEAHLKDSRNLLAAGAASPADVLRVESQVAQAVLFAERAKHLEAVLLEQLRVATHAPDLRGDA